MRKTILTTLSLFFVAGSAYTQNDYQKWREQRQAEYNNFKQQKQEEYENFRKKANDDYAAFLKKRWEEMAIFRGIEPPSPKPVPPVVCPEEDKNRERRDERKPYEDVVVIEPPKPQPEPVEPIKEDPNPVVKPIEMKTQFYGTTLLYALNEPYRPIKLTATGEDNIARAWQQLSQGQNDKLLEQCLALRKRHRLGDWAYILLLDQISVQLVGREDNEATLLMAWLYCQSGYQMRLAQQGGRLYMLYASENLLFRKNYFTLDDERYYPYKGNSLERLYICSAAFPKEQRMTMQMAASPLLDRRATPQRTLQSKRFPSLSATTTVNRNLIDFYNQYPTGTLSDFFGTRWAMYANTPLSAEARDRLYPQLRQKLNGKSGLQAAEELLNWVQTAFVYEYDDTVWGCDRAFFAEETLFYPYADCEDRSILFSRLVRDLLGLRVVLLYYPGHLATAVRFEGQRPKGDYLTLKDGDYYVADPTYIGATIGMTMPDLKDAEITVIELR